MQNINRDLYNITNVTSTILYFKSPNEAVIVNGNNELKTISISDCKQDFITDRYIRGIILEKLVNFGFVKENECTILKVGKTKTLLVFKDNTIRMDIKELEGKQLYENTPAFINTDDNHINDIVGEIIACFVYDYRFYIHILKQKEKSNILKFDIICTNLTDEPNKSFRVSLYSTRELRDKKEG